MWAVLVSLFKSKWMQQALFMCCLQNRDGRICSHWGNTTPVTQHQQFSCFSHSSSPCCELWVPWHCWWVKSMWFCGWSPGQRSSRARFLLHLSPASCARCRVYSHTRRGKKAQKAVFLQTLPAAGWIKMML